MTQMKKSLRLLYGLLLVCLVGCFSQSPFEVQKAVQYDSLFNRQNGWTGADGAYTISLSQGNILWLYGDTWVGNIRNNRHVDATLINNSVAIQKGRSPNSASITFFFNRTPEGKFSAFIQPLDGKGWFWPYHGLMDEEDLYLFLIQIDRTDDSQPAGFKIIGTWLGHVSNPEQSPKQWRVTQHKVPWGELSGAGDLVFGSWLLIKDGFIYIYGTSEDIINQVHHKYMVLARVPVGSLEQFNEWRFFSKGKWVDDFSRISRLCSNMANEYSVSYLPVLGKYIVVYSQNSVSEDIMIRLAPEPHGPWSDPLSIYKCPEASWDDGIYCYAAKAHPALTLNADEMIITYVANSDDFWKMAADARLYRPRFIRVKFHSSSFTNGQVSTFRFRGN